MSTFQILLAMVILILALCVIVQAAQEMAKSVLNTKADTMAKTIVSFMGNHLTLPQVQTALQTRGLDVTALEHFSKEDFRHLLDGIDFAAQPLQGIVTVTGATLEQKKDNIAAAYEDFRASFQKAYTSRNKTFSVVLSFIVVLALNANVIMLYQELAADQVLTQAIAGKASTLVNSNQAGAPDAGSFQSTYRTSRKTIGDVVAKYPPIVRDAAYKTDFSERLPSAIIGLLLMGLLVSLGAPFWNDVLKGMTGVNNALNTNTRQM
jgi:hypothetical protein